MSIGLDVACGPSSSWNANAADACPVGSTTETDTGSFPARNQSTIFPSSNVTTPNPLGDASERTNLLALTRTDDPCREIESTCATPPGRFRNCQGGFTWNGLRARYNVSFLYRRELLVRRYRVYKTDESTGPAANGDIVRSMSLVLHTTWGSGNPSTFDATEVFTSFHVSSLPSMSRNGSIENCPRPTSTNPSSLTSASALS